MYQQWAAKGETRSWMRQATLEQTLGGSDENPAPSLSAVQDFHMRGHHGYPQTTLNSYVKFVFYWFCTGSFPQTISLVLS